MMEGNRLNSKDREVTGALNTPSPQGALSELPIVMVGRRREKAELPHFERVAASAVFPACLRRHLLPREFAASVPRVDRVAVRVASLYDTSTGILSQPRGSVAD